MLSVLLMLWIMWCSVYKKMNLFGELEKWTLEKDKINHQNITSVWSLWPSNLQQHVHGIDLAKKCYKWFLLQAMSRLYCNGVTALHIFSLLTPLMTWNWRFLSISSWGHSIEMFSLYENTTLIWAGWIIVLCSFFVFFKFIQMTNIYLI